MHILSPEEFVAEVHGLGDGGDGGEVSVSARDLEKIQAGKDNSSQEVGYDPAKRAAELSHKGRIFSIEDYPQSLVTVRNIDGGLQSVNKNISQSNINYQTGDVSATVSNIKSKQTVLVPQGEKYSALFHL